LGKRTSTALGDNKAEAQTKKRPAGKNPDRIRSSSWDPKKMGGKTRDPGILSSDEKIKLQFTDRT